MPHIQLRDRYLAPTFDNILKQKETQDLEYVNNAVNTSGYYGQAITHITPAYSGYVPAGSGTLVLNSNQQMWVISGTWSPSNRWIATHESYWHIASNWSLGHVPLEEENVIFSGTNIGKCNIHGDVTIHNFIIEDDCTVHVDVADGVTVHANLLDIGANSIFNFNASNILCDGNLNINSHAIVPTNNSNITFTAAANITSSTADWYNKIYGDKINTS